MLEVLAVAIVLMLGYIAYLRLQLHIQQRIVNAFQTAAVVVPPAARPRSDIHPGLVVLGMLFMAAAGCALLAR